MNRAMLSLTVSAVLTLSAIAFLQGRATGQVGPGHGFPGVMTDGPGRVAAVDPGPDSSLAASSVQGTFFMSVTGTNTSTSYNVPAGKKLFITAVTASGQPVTAVVLRNPLKPNGQPSSDAIMVARAVADKDTLNSESQQFPSGIAFQSKEKITLGIFGEGAAFVYGSIR